MVKANHLGDYLKARRARVTPAEVGLVSGPRRRLAGLRRDELAMLAGVARTATVVAETEMVIDVLNPREFSSLLQQNPTIAKKIYLQAIRRLYEDNQRGLQ